MDYETALKKLINILKFKHTDALKEIEELWDTINSTTTTTINNSKNDVIVDVPKGNIKRTASDLQTISKKQKLNPINNGSGNGVSLKTTTTTTTLPKVKTSEQLNIFNGVGDNKNDVNLELKQQQQPVKEQNVIFSNDIEMNTDDGSNGETSLKNGHLSKIDDYAIDMGLTCDICLTLTQEQNNKLAECQECKRQYHQQCHKPAITNEEIQDPRKLWYCTKCIKNVKNFANNGTHNKNGVSKLGVVNNNADDNSLKLYKRQSSNENSNGSSSSGGSSNGNVNGIHHDEQTTVTNSNSSNNIHNNNNNDQKLFFKRDPKVSTTSTTTPTTTVTTTSVLNNHSNNNNISTATVTPTIIINDKVMSSDNKSNIPVNNINGTIKGFAALASKFSSSTSSTSLVNDKNLLKSPTNTSKQQQTSPQSQTQPFMSKLKGNNNNSNSTIPSFSKLGAINDVKPFGHTLKTATNSSTSNNTNSALGLAEKKIVSMK